MGKAEIHCSTSKTQANDLGGRSKENRGCPACKVGETEESRVMQPSQKEQSGLFLWNGLPKRRELSRESPQPKLGAIPL